MFLLAPLISREICWLDSNQKYLLLMMCVVDGAENVFDVVIYVPSARENFDQRNAIRETWLGHINQNDTLQNRFAFWYYLCTHTHTHTSLTALCTGLPR